MTDHAVEFEWNDIYTGDASDYMEPDPELVAVIEGLPPGRALDVGCGAGALVAVLAERGWQVVGVDIAPRAIQAARKVLAARALHAELRVEDAAAWQPEGQFDLITNSFALPTTQADQGKLFETIRGSLAPGGTVAIKDFDASMKRLEEFAPYHCPTIDELLAAFDGLEIVQADIRETPAHSHGHGHDGVSGPPPTAVFLCARMPPD